MKLFLCVYTVEPIANPQHKFQMSAAVLGVDLKSCQHRLQFGAHDRVIEVLSAQECANGVIPVM